MRWLKRMVTEFFLFASTGLSIKNDFLCWLFPPRFSKWRGKKLYTHFDLSPFFCGSGEKGGFGKSGCEMKENLSPKTRHEIKFLWFQSKIVVKSAIVRGRCSGWMLEFQLNAFSNSYSSNSLAHCPLPPYIYSSGPLSMPTPLSRVATPLSLTSIIWSGYIQALAKVLLLTLS